MLEYGSYRIPTDWATFHRWRKAVQTSTSKLLHYTVRQPATVTYKVRSCG